MRDIKTTQTEDYGPTMNVLERVGQRRKVQAEGLELFCPKNTDYGDAFAQAGLVGILVSLENKIARLENITRNQITAVKTESLHDTLIDLHN